jgi:hypothetical protein
MTQEQRRECVEIWLTYWKLVYGVATDKRAISAALGSRRRHRNFMHNALDAAAPLRKWLLQYHGLHQGKEAYVGVSQTLDGAHNYAHLMRFSLVPSTLVPEDVRVTEALKNPVISAVREKYDAIMQVVSNYKVHDRNDFGFFFDHLYPRTLPKDEDYHTAMRALRRDGWTIKSITDEAPCESSCSCTNYCAGGGKLEDDEYCREERSVELDNEAYRQERQNSGGSIDI